MVMGHSLLVNRCVSTGVWCKDEFFYFFRLNFCQCVLIENISECVNTM